jgi:hypothetical protein
MTLTNPLPMHPSQGATDVRLGSSPALWLLMKQIGELAGSRQGLLPGAPTDPDVPN